MGADKKEFLRKHHQGSGRCLCPAWLMPLSGSSPSACSSTHGCLGHQHLRVWGCCSLLCGWWAAFVRLAAGRAGMGHCCLAAGTQDEANTLLLRWESLLSACRVCPSVLALPGQPPGQQTVSWGHGSSGSRHGTALGSSNSRQVLFPLASVERGTSLFGNGVFPTASTCCPLSLHRAKQTPVLLLCLCRVLQGGALCSVWGAGAAGSPWLCRGASGSCSPGMAGPGAQPEIK